MFNKNSYIYRSNRLLNVHVKKKVKKKERGERKKETKFTISLCQYEGKASSLTRLDLSLGKGKLYRDVAHFVRYMSRGRIKIVLHDLYFLFR